MRIKVATGKEVAAQVVTVAAVVAGAEAQAGARGGLIALANAAPGLKTG